MINGPELKSLLDNSSDENTESSIFLQLFSLGMIESAILRLKEKDKEKADKAWKQLAKLRKEDKGLKEFKKFVMSNLNSVGQLDTFEKALSHCYDGLVEDFVEEEEYENGRDN